MPYYPPEEYPALHAEIPQPLRWFRATRVGRFHDRLFSRMADALDPHVDRAILKLDRWIMKRFPRR